MVNAAGAVRVRRLARDDAAALAGLLAAYGAEMRHAPRGGDDDFRRAAALLDDRVAETFGAFLADRLIGFAVVFDLPEAISGRRAGQLDDLYVAPEARGRRIAGRLIAAATETGRRRDWVHLRWLVPEDNAAARKAYEVLAETAPWKSYVLWLRGGERW